MWPSVPVARRDALEHQATAIRACLLVAMEKGLASAVFEGAMYSQHVIELELAGYEVVAVAHHRWSISWATNAVARPT